MDEEATKMLKRRIADGDLKAALMAEKLKAVELVNDLEKAARQTESPAVREALTGILQRIEKRRVEEIED